MALHAGSLLAQTTTWTACSSGSVLCTTAGNNVGIGTTTPAYPLQIGAGLTSSLGVTAGQMQINNTPIVPWEASLVVLTQPAFGANVADPLDGVVSDFEIPASSTVNYEILEGTQSTVRNYGSGTVTGAYGSWSVGSNYSSTAAVNVAAGVYANAVNNSAGTITSAYGVVAGTTNQASGGAITNAYGVAAHISTAGGPIGTAYGLSSAVTNSGGTITTGYGLYIGNVQATTHYGLYESDTSNNYFAGNVGIGITNPQNALSVNGNIQAKEVVVTESPADYVFDPDYKLAPLSEVAQYVEDHHHLPDIPSAAEVQQKGMSVGDMQSKLLAKIEELTLHMIQAEERNNRLEQKNRELEERISRIEHGSAGSGAK